HCQTRVLIARINPRGSVMPKLSSIGNVAAGAYCALATMFILMSAQVGQAAEAPVVSQTPLSVGGNVPGNLLLVPSVEWPTIDSVANLGNYGTGTEYVGYFDSDKCYLYSYSANEPDR